MASRASSDVIVRFIGDTGNLDKGLDGLQGRFIGVAQGLKGIAAAAGVVETVAFFKNAIGQASDLNEATSKTGVIFGKAASDVERYAAAASDAIGQSKRSALDAAATFATFGKAAGLSGQDLTGFATKLVSLSSDLSSFHNADPAEVIEALGAGLRGEAEPMQRFGVLLNDAQLRNAALSQGLIKTTKEALTPQQKVLAAYQVILDQTGDAQGDFARTADGLANSQRTLAARFEDSQAAVGQKFLPIAQEVTHVLADGVLPAVAGVADVLSATLVPVVETAFGTVKGLVGVFTDLPGPVQAAAIALATWHVVGGQVQDTVSGLAGGVKGLGDDVKTAMGAFEVGRVQGTFMALEERIPLVASMGTAFRTAKGDVDGFGATMKGVGAAGFTAVKAGASGLMSILGGPLGIAITGVTLGLALFANRGKEAEERQRKLTDASKDVARALQEENNELNKKTRQAAASALEENGLLEMAEKHAVNTSLLTDAYLGNDKARQQVNAGIRGQIAALEDLRNATLEANDPELAAEGITPEYYQQQINGLKGVQTAIDGAIGTREQESAAIDRTARAAREETAATEGVAGAKSRLMGSEQSFQAVLEATGLEYDSNKTRLENLLSALKAYNNEVTGATDTEEGWFAALDQLTEGVKENGATLDISTAKGRDNRDALEELSSKTKQLYIDQLNAGVATDVATETYNRNMQQVYDTAGALGFNNEQANALIETYGRVPPNVVTEYTAKGYEDVWAKIQSLSAGQILGEKGMPVTPANVRAVQKDLKMGAYAAGGPVSGPGSSTSDDIIARLSNNEHVWTAREVDAAGGHGSVASLRKAALAGKLPAYAEGGAVVWPFSVNLSKFKIPDPFAAAMAAAAKGGIGGGVQRWAGLVLEVLKMLGQPAALLPNVLRRMNQESGGNPNAINLWDSNAKKGQPSQGLMQTIPGTFAAYAGPFRNRGIMDPLANIYAGLNYAIHRYPSLQYAMDKPGGYKDGGWLMPGQVGVNETSRPEPVLSTSQWAAFERLVPVLERLAATWEKNSGPTRVIDVGGIHVTNRPVDVMQQIRFAEMMAGV